MPASKYIEHYKSTLIEYRRLWIVPAILGLVLTGVYAFVIRGDTWTARQSMIIRDDLLGTPYKPGRFESQESLKSAQETVLEIARKPQVIRNAMRELGPEPGGFFGSVSDDWPSDRTIESMQGAITFSAPNGAEFGKTEMIVLNVKSSSRPRAVALVHHLLREIDIKLSEVRVAKLGSMQKELKEASLSSQRTLAAAALRLNEMESDLGADLMTMRDMNEPRSGTSAFDGKLNEIRSERRKASADLASARKQRDLLIDARRSRDLDVATSAELLAMQPAIASLMTGLATAQMELANAEGRYQPTHPVVKSSRETVDAAKNRIRAAISPAISGLDSQISVLENGVNQLDRLIADQVGRLGELTGQRVAYSTLEQEVQKKSDVLSETQGKLAAIESLAGAARNVALLTPVDAPQVSTRPDGLGERAMTLAGAIGGLMIGLGLVMIVAPPINDPETFPGAENLRDRETSPVDATNRSTSRLEAMANSQKTTSAPEVEPSPPTTPPVPSPAPAPTPTATAKAEVAAAVAAGLTGRTSAQMKQFAGGTAAATPTAEAEPEPRQTRPEIVFADSQEGSGMTASVSESSRLMAEKIDSLSQDLAAESQVPPPSQERETASTVEVQTDGVAPGDAIPLQRRPQSQRPVDIAREADRGDVADSEQTAIDEAFADVAVENRPRTNPFNYTAESAKPVTAPVEPAAPEADRSNPFLQTRAEVQSTAAPETASTANNPYSRQRAEVASSIAPETDAATENPFSQQRSEVESVVAPASKPVVAPKPPAVNESAADEAKYEKVDPSITTPPLPIPSQIRKLSDSISSFADFDKEDDDA